MDEIKNNLKNINYFTLKLSICFVLIFIALLVLTSNSNVVFANSQNAKTNEKPYIYLSDMDWHPSSNSGWQSLLKDQTSNGSLISVKVENNLYSFPKGIWAHATSNVIYDISSYSDIYTNFMAYIGLNSTASSSSNGVKFYIYTTTDDTINNNTNWELKTSSNPEVTMPGTNATYVKIDITGAKYLKLVADSNGPNGNDHSVYADAKIVKSDYEEEEENLIPNIDILDEEIKTKFANADLSNKEFELKLLQRELVNRVGNYGLKRFLQESNANKETFNWLINDVDNLRLYIIGGEPDGGSYYNSLKILSELYTTYKDDFNIETNTKYGNNLGDLYKRMAITLSLTHSSQVALWMQPSTPENQSDAVVRYQIYKDMHKNDKFVVSSRQDHTKWFEELKIEELRFVLNNPIDDEELLWLNEYTQKYIDAHPNKEEEYLQPHHYMKYIWPNYSKPEYHNEANKQMWSDKYGNFLDYGVSFRPGLYKLWMNLDNGAVCGGISKIGSNIRAVHGTPSSVISQPGHAAIIYYRKDTQGRGYWTIDNDVSGWAQSGRTERLNLRMPLGWGNEEYIDFDDDWLGMATYVLIAQGALNDFDNYQESKELLMLSEVYKDEPEKLYELYRKSLEAESINIDAWYALIKLYRADDTKTEADFYALGEEIFEKLKYYPLPMYHLEREIEKELHTDQYKFKFILAQTKALKEASVATSNESIQFHAVKQEASYLLGQFDSKLASFSFDGEDAEKIVLSSRFDNSGIRWDYSLDNKQTWHDEVFFTADEDHKWLLSKEEINNITAENDIYIHIIGAPYTEENFFKIDIKESAGLPSTLYANDLENKLIAAVPTMKWKINENDDWTYYRDEEPDLSGTTDITVIAGATGEYLESKTPVTYHFTQNDDPDTRKYISISHLQINSVSSEATAQGRYARNAIDGNINTNWHSAWNGSDRDKYIIIELDEPKYLTALEYFPVAGGNGKIENAIISVSMDGENWTEVVSGTDWRYANTNDISMKNVEFTATQAKYIKLVGAKTQSASSSNSFIAAKMFNLYEDTTNKTAPTAEIKYSTNTSTTGNVIATLVNPSTEITITNNNGNNTYTFNENGSFIFEFVDKYGNTGTATATVTWIIKEEKPPINPDNPDSDYKLGDINGDGKITITDLAQIKLHLIEKRLLTGKSLKAADIDGSGKVTITDMAKLKLILIDL